MDSLTAAKVKKMTLSVDTKDKKSHCDGFVLSYKLWQKNSA